MTLTTQMLGYTAANIAEVEAATKALRVTVRPIDYKSLGGYCLSGASGTMAAGLAAASPIWSWRWGAKTPAVVSRIILSVGNTGTAFTAGIVQFNLFMARSFTASDSGGTSLLPSGNQNKLRTTGMATTALTDCRIATTGTLTAGTRGLDGDPVSSLICGVPAVAGSKMIPPTPFFEQRPGEFPFVMQQDEGFVIQTGGIAIAATGTWVFGVRIDWDEVASYP